MKNSQSITWLAILIALISIAFTSCDFKSSGLKPSTGKTNELLVVTNSKADWEGLMGKEIKEFFGQELAGLPQPESMYSMAHIPDPNFGEMFKPHHNIFIVDVDPEIDKPILETRKDLWASPQRVIKMTVPDREQFFTEFAENKEAFIEFFNENERRRVSRAFDAIEDYSFRNRLVDKFDVSMRFPKSFYVATETKDFIWLRREAEQFSQAVAIYFYPYDEMTAFNPEVIIHVQDSVTKKHIPGPSAGSYMKVSMFDPPVAKQIEFNGAFAVEMRGIWEVEGDFMGGPFISYTTVDERHNRVVTLLGYVYNPGQDKKDLLRQVEAILHTFEYPEAEDANPDK
ncbi:MAG: hypothetical protein B6D64_04355 [Bacteroidetes bacterium 4484_276]|nr:MAG: hypothetical protein B6D64_04355 [Bacteroidetes bacterium 4484_276]OYT13377.1 MAG: hypothetical protein B6I19_05405 [Bacteroidetes bacterium 4572_114]